MTKKRYLKSFSLTLILYSMIFATIILNFDSIKKAKVEDNKRLISLNQVYIVAQEKKVIKKKEKKVKRKKIVKKKIEKKIVKKQIREKPKKIKKLVKKSKPKELLQKVVEKQIKEKTKIDEKLVEKEHSWHKKEIIEKKVVRNYSKEYLDKHLKEIVKLIQQNIRYPKMAKRLNIQGEVVIEFKLLNTGKVLNIKPISGHKFLIKSSIKAIEKASKNFPKVNSEIKIKVPINYKLV